MYVFVLCMYVHSTPDFGAYIHTYVPMYLMPRNMYLRSRPGDTGSTAICFVHYRIEPYLDVKTTYGVLMNE